MRLLAGLILATLAATTPSRAQAPDGRALFERADKGHCGACHQVPGPAAQKRAEVGPPLSGTRMRELGRVSLKAIVSDLTSANPATPMPPYARHRILDNAEIDRVVGYLLALPAEAPPPVAEGMPPAGDATQRAAAIDAGRKIAQRKFKDGRTIASCFPNGGRRVAAAYPQYDARVKRVVTLETAVNQCLKTHKEPLLDPAEGEMASLMAYLRSLSDGQKVAVRVPPGAEDKLADGKRLFHTRMGQRNYACASCHAQNAGKAFDGLPLSAAASQAAQWPTMRDGKPVTLQVRMRECLERMGAAPFAAGSDELNHIEYYLTTLANKQPMLANTPRAR